MISTSIKLDGEQEFKKQLGDVNSNLRTLRSDLQLTTAEFKGQANSLEALEAKDRVLNDMKEQQIEKIRALEDALKQVGEVYKDQPKKLDEYQRSLNSARVELLRLEAELKDNAKYMDEARKSTDKTADSLDEFGDVVNKADGGGLKNLAGNLGVLKDAIVGGAVVAGIKEVSEAIFEITDATKEYREIMGSLEASSLAAGYTAEETAETFNRLFSVMGDYDAAKEATAQLQALGLSQENLNELTMQTIGAWTALGGAAPIETLAESIQQTIATGEATGAFSDILVNAGLSEEYFNEQLEQCNTKTERANHVMATLSKEGMSDLGQSWIDINEDIVAANESQQKWDDAMAGLGEYLQPAADALRSFGADAVEFVTEKLKGAVEWIQKLYDKISNFKWEGAHNAVGWLNERLDGLVPTGSHAGGLSYVPYDGYVAQLHKGETVLTANEATAMRDLLADLQTGNISTPQPDLQAFLAAVVANQQQNSWVGEQSFKATITLATEDGREFGKYVAPFVSEENKSNPEVVSDPL